MPIIAQGFGSDAHEENPYDFDGGGVEMRITGWIHMGGRYYSPLTKPFTQRDSADAPLDAALANRYAFASGDPINNVDPTGRGILSAAGKALDAARAIHDIITVDSDDFNREAAGVIAGAAAGAACAEVLTTNVEIPACVAIGSAGGEAIEKETQRWDDY